MKHHFKSLRAALRWRKHHRRSHVKGVTVVANAPIKPQQHVALTPAQHAVHLAHASLAFAGKMTYSMKADRSGLFHRAVGDFGGAHADCSQWYSSIVHWCGNKVVTDTDWTGTLVKKGHPLAEPQIACAVVFGAGDGEHVAMATERVNGVWYCVGFGHQGAPDRVSLPDLKAYFKREGHPGVRYFKFV